MSNTICNKRIFPIAWVTLLTLCLFMLTACAQHPPSFEPQSPNATVNPTESSPTESTPTESSPAEEPTTPPSTQPSAPIPSVPSDMHQHEYTSVVTPPSCTREGYTVYLCTCGDQHTSGYTPATGHHYQEEVITPTCVDDGFTIYSCDCGEQYIGAYTNALGHNWWNWGTISAPTETSEGIAERSCSTCGVTELKKMDKLIPSHSHSYTATVTKEPTCTHEGIKTHTCSCGESYTESIGMLNHSYTSKITSPTCTKQGYTTHICNRCSFQCTDSKTPATGHRYSLANTIAATCLSNGSKTYTCNNCTDTYSETITGGHQYQHTTIAPTCTEAGYTKHTCAICSHSYADELIATTGHKWSGWKRVWPTCLEAGYSFRTCACGAKETEEGDSAYGHSHIISGEQDGKIIYSCRRCSDSYAENIDTRYDASLAVPEIASVHPGSANVGINCYATFEDDSGYGYQCLLSRNADFTKEIKSTKTDYQWNNQGYAKLSFYYISGSYFYKIRAYKIDGDTFVYGPWSEVHAVSCLNNSTRLNKEATYTYDMYFVDSLGSNVYTENVKALYIKTENPDVTSLHLTIDGKNIMGNISTWGKAYYYDDVEYLDITDSALTLHKVPGGYLGLLAIETVGQHTVEVCERYPEGYVVAKTFQLTVLDYETERNKWIDNVIATQTNASMNPKQKMDAIAQYLNNGQFKYVTVRGKERVTLAAMPNSPWFLSMRWDSYTSPAMLAVFAERIGGFEEIHNCFSDYSRGTSEWKEYHHQTYVVYKGTRFYYSVCPYTPTGDVGSIEMIDFEDTSKLTLIG